jgi:hypothetical protein
MKNFKEYLSESKKQYPFRVKIAGDFTTEQEDSLKTLLGRYVLNSFKKSATTPIQALPLDFPQVRNCEVSIYEVTLDYPTTQQELTEYLSTELGVSKQKLVVRRPGEPSEEYQTPTEKREGALLDDPDYKEAGNPQFEDYYGDKYNSGFVKELNDILKLQRKEMGEQIPTPTPDDIMKNPGKTSNDFPQNTTSPIAKDQGTYVVKALNGN